MTLLRHVITFKSFLNSSPFTRYKFNQVITSSRNQHIYTILRFIKIFCCLKVNLLYRFQSLYLVMIYPDLLRILVNGANNEKSVLLLNIAYSYYSWPWLMIETFSSYSPQSQQLFVGLSSFFPSDLGLRLLKTPQYYVKEGIQQLL